MSCQYTVTAANNPANLIMLQEVNEFFGGLGNIYTNLEQNRITLEIKGHSNCLIVREHSILY